MNKLIIACLILFISQHAFSSDENPDISIKKIIPNKDVPSELNLIIDNLQLKSTNNEALIEQLIKIDSLMGLLSKDEIYLISKIEIYKSLLKTRERNKLATVDGSTLKLLDMAISHASSPFQKWFLSALQNDAQFLINSKIYKEYLLQQGDVRSERIEFKKIEKKIQIIYRWVNILMGDPENISSRLNIELNPLLKAILINIEQSFRMLAQERLLLVNAVLNKSEEKMRYFKVKVITPETSNPKNKAKSIEEILSPITNSNSSEDGQLPAPSNDNWLDDESTPASFKNLPKPSDDADWLQDI